MPSLGDIVGTVGRVVDLESRDLGSIPGSITYSYPIHFQGRGTVPSASWKIHVKFFVSHFVPENKSEFFFFFFFGVFTGPYCKI